jgi:hypothetical protein
MIMKRSFLAALLAASAAGHAMVGYIQKEGSTEVCTMRVPIDHSTGYNIQDGNYGPDQQPGADACGVAPGTPKKVLKYSGDGTDLRTTALGAGPYLLNVQETDADCVFAPGDKVNAYVHVSGNHGGRTADGDGAWWGYRKFDSNAAFQKIPGSETDYDINGPLGSYGHHVESFVLPSQLESGWYTLRWEWHAPGNTLHFVNCVEVQVAGGAPTTEPGMTTQTTSTVTTSPAVTTTPSTTSPRTTSPGAIQPIQWPTECGETRPCARVAMLPGGEVRISMTGPANVWFGIGFDAVEMRDEPYAIIVSGDGTVSERKLAFHSAGDELDPQTTVLQDSVAGGVRTVTLVRLAVGKSAAHHTFTSESINYIWAYGLQSNFGFHNMNFGRWASCEPIGDCSLSWCNPIQFFSWCAVENSDSCPGPWCKAGDASLALQTPAPTAPTPAPASSPPEKVPAPTPVPAPVPVPVPAPRPFPSGRRCVPSGTESFSDPAVWGPVCASQGQANLCTAPICKWENGLRQANVQRHQFLGKVLIQARAKVKRHMMIRDQYQEF